MYSLPFPEDTLERHGINGKEENGLAQLLERHPVLRCTHPVTLEIDFA
jgi:hypothetical protein